MISHKKPCRLTLPGLALCVLVANPAQAALPLAVEGNELPTLAPMLDRVMPAVVNIATTSTLRIRENPLLQDPFFRRFFDLPEPRRRRQTQSLGSGVIIDAVEGLVITNTHVVEKADEITVTLQDARTFSAEVIGADPDSDVAVIRISAEDLTAIKIGDSDRLRVGDFVVAIGNPFGLNQTVTSGIVSALGRSGLGIEGYEDFIQTDASINPGNSGGALVNLRGELVGINTAILAPAGGNVGIGFAIPINMVRELTSQLVEHGRIQRGQLGVYIQDLTPELAQAFGMDRNAGAVISQIVPDSPAAGAGLREGDVVTEVNGRRIDDAADLRNAVGLLRVGQEVELIVLRKGRTRKITARIDAMVQEYRDGAALHGALAGARFADLPPDRRTRSLQQGVWIEQVKPGSSAWNAGLREEDVIVSANRRPLASVEEFADAVRGAGTLLLNIRRGDAAFFLAIH